MSQTSIELPVSFTDFPYVCRVCLGGDDLELFKEECMIELFFKITSIAVDSRTNLPRKICKECLNTLIDISVFIDALKLNDATFNEALMNLEDEESKTNQCENSVEPHQVSSICRTCLSKTGLNPIEENSSLFSLLQNITDIEMKPDTSLQYSICSNCLEKLEQIFAFINLSRRNDECLHQAFTNRKVKLENNENYSETKQNATHWIEEWEPDNTHEESMVPLEEIKVEMVVKEESNGIDYLNFQRQTVPTDKIKIEAVEEKHMITEELNPKNELTIIENGMFSCKTCSKDFPDLPEDYNGKYPGPCNICGKLLDENQEMNNDGTRASQEKLNVEKKRSYKKRKPPFKCEICSKTVLLYSSLRNHMKKHSEDRPFKCETCHKTFYRKYDLKFHMKRHTNEKPFQCGVCGKCFSNKTYLRLHMGVHAIQKPFQCEICSKLISSGSSLRYHMKTHAGLKPFTCEVCSKSFSVKGTLNVHMRIHSGENLSECEVCFKLFTQKSELKGHMRLHTGEKPFQCEVCSKCFTLKGTLNVHMRIHAEEKPFSCDVCLKGFCQKSEMKSHMRIHTGERPYPCEVCAKTYAQKAHLRSHMRTHRPKILTSETMKILDDMVVDAQ